MNAEKLAEELHNVGLNPYVNYAFMGKSAALWDKFRLDLAIALLEKLDIKYKSNSRFKKPTIEEIKSYCRERNNSINAEQFYDFYESKNWMIGKNKMKNWQAAVRTWERNQKSQEPIIEDFEEIPYWKRRKK